MHQMKGMHWAFELIDKPWAQGARGPHAFDCWGLLVWLYRHRHGVELPDVPGADRFDFLRLFNEEIAHPTTWQRVAVPFECCAVALGGTSMFHHVGYYLDTDGGLVLHACDGKNVIAQSVTGLKASGMQRIQYFKHRGAHYRDLKSV